MKTLAIISSCLLLLSFIVMPFQQAVAEKQCSYNTYKWNTRDKKAVDFHRVVKAYTELDEVEIDALTGCSVCEQDQVEIKLPGIRPFRICKLLANDVASTMQRLIDEGFPINSVVAYRPGMTRGDVDQHGNRTRFSNHSFGIALDINSQLNGLYDQCLEYGPHCRLIRGGPWRPGVPGTLTRDGPVVTAMRRLGLLWGGEIQGWQKDFMHFSPTGY